MTKLYKIYTITHSKTKPWKGEIFIENNNHATQKLQRSEILQNYLIVTFSN